MSSMKKRKLLIILILSGIALFFVSIVSFIILAVVTKGNVTSLQLTLAWIFLILVLLGSLLSVVSTILYIIANKDNIKEYLNKISKL